METTNMQKRNQETDQFLPEEIICHIISRLPVKSLFRFRCVCKSWKSLISDPKFLLMTNNGRERAIFWSKSKKNPSFYSLDRDLVFTKLPNPLENIPFDSSNQEYIFLGSCNGLLLFSVSTSIFLWNPSTTHCRKVLKLNLLTEDYVIKASGLCFDESSGDYKMIIALRRTRMDRRRFVFLANLTRKVCTEISFPYQTYYFSHSSSTIINGNLHWIIKETKGDPESIVFFDPRFDRFNKLPMPEHKVGDSGQIFGLGGLDGCLIMSRFGNIWNKEHTNEVLIMKEYGVEGSWSFLCCIPLKIVGGEGWVGWLPPIFYTQKNQEEALVTNGIDVSVFRLKDKSLRDVDFPEDPSSILLRSWKDPMGVLR
ncbi:hypothetical protein ACH5RR_032987 [Cinchona calisaya]|uniref:F-box domain-containing protein n=1 Tax=Cinchona calisaya TaxID=153742 RepID=A0ABD2YJP1_9GENT